MKGPRDLCLAGAVVLVPAAVTVGLLKGLVGAALVDYSPYYNDEIHFWHSILTFERVGFDGGYYVIDEMPAPAAASHFGPHGPLFPVIYGTLAHIVGWRLYSGPLLNLVLVTWALCLFVGLARPDRGCLVRTGVFLATCWPLLLLLPTTMQESVHQAVGIALAGLFYRLGYGSEDGRSRHRLWLAAGALIVSASLLRFTWSVLLLPLLLLRGPTVSGRAVARGVAQAAAGAAFVYLAFRYLAAPVPDAVVSRALAARSWPESGWVLLRNTAENLGAVVSWRGHPLEVLLFSQAVLLVLLAVTGWPGSRFRSPAPPLHWRPKPVRLLLLLNPGAPLALTLVFYTIYGWRGFRILAPHVTLSALLLVRRCPGGIWPIVLTNLLLTLSFAGAYTEFRTPQFDRANRADLSSLQRQVAGILVHRGDADPWCNTLLVDAGNYPPAIAGIPAGIGLSVVSDWSRMSRPLRSRYVVLDEGRYEEVRVTTPLEFLAHTRLGDLWRNVHSPCR